MDCVPYDCTLYCHMSTETKSAGGICWKLDFVSFDKSKAQDSLMLRVSTQRHGMSMSER